MKIKVSPILFFIFFSFTSCVKEFIPHVEKYDQLLVVEGAITDKPGPYVVKLSISGDVREKSYYNPYSKCIVEIADDLGNSETLVEVSEGVYKTDSLGIQGIVGRKYKIRISTPDEQLYESQEEVLRKGIGIQSVSAELEHNGGRDGYQFYVDAENYVVADSNYFFWSLESTYKFKTDFNITDYYNGVKPIKPFPKPDSLRTGYRTQQILEIFNLNTMEQNLVQPIHIPLNYEDNYSKALTIRYSLKVNQYTISKDAYTYWNTLKKMNADQGSLYAQQPYQVKGNMVNLSNPKKPALGYFMVAGMNEKRIFVDPPSVVFYYPVCQPDNNVPCGDCVGPWIYRTRPSEWPIYITNGHVLNPECVDCREEGFLKKPDFWID